jgi:hypothetical protein
MAEKGGSRVLQLAFTEHRNHSFLHQVQESPDIPISELYQVKTWN